jgi:hypothetical protein
MCACNFDLNFTFISCGWKGSASDAGVLRSAHAKGFHVPKGKFYLVDGGYANTTSFIAHTEALGITLASLGDKAISMQITRNCSTIGMLSFTIILKGLLVC